ncbi:MAG: hypothetical protein PGN16_03800 [Sphingomonas phyllosphaerae]|uniref:hypothetical protein n=1 Tax=Sphingomonas phyllosphaerae TaxID=257003 RepID=UPI002FFBC660
MTDVDDSPTLSVGFAIRTGDSEEQVGSLVTMMDAAEKRVTRDAELIEKATGSMVKLGGGVAEFTAFGNASTRAAQNIAREQRLIEKSGEGMVRQMERQAEVFGKSTSEIRSMRAELKAAAADAQGMTELANRIRNADAQIRKLEAGSRAVTGATGQQRASMQNLGFQLQDFSVQVVGGTSALRAFAMQAPQAAGALNGFGGTLGKVGGFLAGPWGIALTLATTLGAGLAESLWSSAKAADGSKKAKEGLKDAVDRLNGSSAALNRTTQIGIAGEIAASEATRQLEIRKRGLLDVLLREQQVRLGNARATEANSGGTVPGAGPIGRGVASMEREIRATEAALKANGTRMIEAQNAVIKGRGALIRMDVAGALDAATAATQKHDRAVDKLQRQYEAGKISAAQYQAQLMGEGRAYTAAQKAISDAEKADKAAGSEARKAHAKEIREQAKAMREAEAAAKALQSAFEGMEGRFDVAGSASRQFRKDMDEIAKFKKAGLIDEGTADAWGFEASRSAADKAAAAIKEVKLQLDDLKLDPADLGVTNLDKMLGTTLNVFDTISRDADAAGNAMSRAFGQAGSSIGDALAILGDYGSQQDRIARAGLTREQELSEMGKLRLSHTAALLGTSKSLFAENSKGYAIMAAGEKALAIVQAARTAVAVANGAANMFASLGPAGFPAVAAMLGVMATLGFSRGGGTAKAPTTNTGTGTVFGDSTAQSESIRRALDALREVDTLMLGTSREMASSLRAIESSIGGFAAQVVRTGNVNADDMVTQGFKTNAIGSVLKAVVPIFGGALASLFGSKTEVVGNGLYGKAQSVGSILSSGFDASYYSDVKKTSKFLGITTGTKYSTQYSAADAGLENQFTLILREFNTAVAAAAGPLGEATGDIQSRLNGFIVNIGRIDLKGLTGTQIEEKLTAVFGAAADGMAAAAFPSVQRFQKAGEGAFETLTRVATTVEAVTGSLDMLGTAAKALGIDAKLGLAAQFDSVGDFTSAAKGYFEAYYTPAEQNAAKLAQLGGVFVKLGAAMPDTLDGFRKLVEAQDLTTLSGQSMYATLLQLAPAFADLKKVMDGARTAADVLAERQDLQRKLLEVRGDTAAIRELDLAKLDASNRALQLEIWGLQAAQDAAKAADELRTAWSSVGDTIMDEVRRIRGLSATDTGASFAMLQGQFNAALLGGRTDMDVAKTLPGLSQSLLKAAADTATSRQEYDRIASQTAAELQAFADAIAQAKSVQAFADAAKLASGTTPDSSAASSEAADLREEVAAMRQELRSLLSDVKTATTRTARVLDNVTGPTGGDRIAVANVR